MFLGQVPITHKTKVVQISFELILLQQIQLTSGMSRYGIHKARKPWRLIRNKNSAFTSNIKGPYRLEFVLLWKFVDWKRCLWTIVHLLNMKQLIALVTI